MQTQACDERDTPSHAGSPAHLRTLGTLGLAGECMTRPKPLLLLAYLALEGPTDRGRLAGLFFGRSRDPRDALSTTLRRLGTLVEPMPDGDPRLTTVVTTDVEHFQMQALLLDPAAALRHYRGPFVQDVPCAVEPELEEWIASTRERLAGVARDLHLAVVRRELRRRRTLPAWSHAKEAVALTEAFALDPRMTGEALARLVGAGIPVPEGWWSAVALSAEGASTGTRQHDGPARGTGSVRRSRSRRTSGRQRRGANLRVPGSRS